MQDLEVPAAHHVVVKRHVATVWIIFAFLQAPDDGWRQSRSI